MTLELTHAQIVGITLSLALAVGVVAQSVARHLRIPGIVLLLASGVVLGPDVLGWINPHALGEGLHILVGFAVAVILFEGGMNLNLKRLKREAKVIRRLLSLGALVTASGAALYTWLLLGWDFEWCVLFGTLMIVTGPTVITPLLRRIKVRRNVETILEAEGVLIDAVGAVVAAATIQVALTPTSSNFYKGMAEVATHLGFGLLAGAAGGFLIGLALRHRRLVPEGLENIFTLALVLALFQFSNAVMEESGIMSVSAAGIVVGNLRTRVQRELLEFKEQLTVMLIGLLFVLLAADVRIDDVVALGWPGVFTVVTLMLVVRPLSIALCTHNSGLTLREKLFLSWLAPRGIVAAAVASLFAADLAARGMPRGEELRALVFLVIVCTVVVQGMTGGLVARALKLRRPTNRGYAIFGANELAQAFGTLLTKHGEEVLFLDRDPRAVSSVEEAGHRAIFGNALEERTLQRAQIDERAACLALVYNEEVNLLFTRRVHEGFRGPHVYVGLRSGETGVTGEMVQEAGARILFGVARDTELWAMRFRRGFAEVEAWLLEDKELIPEEAGERELFETPEELLLPMMIERAGKLTPTHHEHSIKRGDIVHFATFTERADEAHAWLIERGWVPVVEVEPEDSEKNAEAPDTSGAEERSDADGSNDEPDAAMPAQHGSERSRG